MAFVDEMTISAAAGRGGDGVVRWLHFKGKEFSGPGGGNGGDGGDVYMRGVRDVGLLARYRSEKKFAAGNGIPGASFTRAGARGEDLVIDVPLGSVVRNKTTGEVFEFLEEHAKVLVLKGGRGGAGNAVFKSSINRSPDKATPGKEGESAEFSIELRLIADAGLIGLPNAGKTTLLNALTGAPGKVGAYAFTTLDPNLGALHSYVLADIPGLIEGASAGKGLGAKFLRHIARTRMLLHCVSLESDNPLREYEVVRKELAAWDAALVAKPELVILTKTDMCDAATAQKWQAAFAAQGHDTVCTSALDDAAIKKLSETITAKLSAL